MNDGQQEIYINLDDSGKLTSKEPVSVCAGLVFFSKKEKDKFITQYRSIVKDIRCGYCNSVCDNNCPEIKNTNIKPSDKRRLMNHIKRYFIVGLIIKNDDVYEHIIESKAARGRFIDYSLRRLIKPIVYSDLDILISYQDSCKSYVVQAADLLAGTIRKKAIEELDGMNSLVDLFIVLP